MVLFRETLFATLRVVGICSVLIGAMSAAFAQENHWRRCNTHTHTGDAWTEIKTPARDAVEWYRQHGYQCVFVTDHEHLTDVSALNRRHGAADNFLVLSGQEITQMLDDSSWASGTRHFHVNGLGTSQTVFPIGWPVGDDGKPASWRQILASGAYPKAPRDAQPHAVFLRNVEAVYAAGGLPQVNHPNLAYSVKPEDLQSIRRPFLLEVWNAFPTSNNLGGVADDGARALSTEELWDALLTRGQLVWGTASDDTHDYTNFDRRETTPTPGKAWIVVDAPELTREAIMDALRKGRFYASNGITVTRYAVDRKSIWITLTPPTSWSAVAPPPNSEAERKLRADTRFETRFIGAGGKVLATVYGSTPSFAFSGKETYVRASITDSDGRRAWTQPVFFDGRASEGLKDAEEECPCRLKPAHN